jgi:hypothetical protein
MGIVKLLNTFHLSKHKISESIAYLFNFFYIRMYLIIIAGIVLLNWLFVYIININVSQDLVVLHYNVDFGVNLIGNVKQIYIIPLLGTIMFSVNLILLIFTFRLNHRITSAGKFFAHSLLGVTLLVNLLLLLALILIYLINFFI